MIVQSSSVRARGTGGAYLVSGGNGQAVDGTYALVEDVIGRFGDIPDAGVTAASDQKDAIVGGYRRGVIVVDSVRNSLTDHIHHQASRVVGIRGGL